MQPRFLLGPAGSGKTSQCLAEIRSALGASPEGPPLILLAPKQATFQLERQLLSGGELVGYTRLMVFSFERLARFLVEQLCPAATQFLSEEGRLMVLRALVTRRQPELELFRASARLPGFARQLSSVLTELSHSNVSLDRLEELAKTSKLPEQLRKKVRDLRLILNAYFDWLKQHNLHDGATLLNTASAVLREGDATVGRTLQVSGLWLDGFATLSISELELLSALAPFCGSATLAFCLESRPVLDAPPHWLSTWSAVSQTFRRCFMAMEALAQKPPEVQVLSRRHSVPGPAMPNRFAENRVLQHLEQHWAEPRAFNGTADEVQRSVRLVGCQSPEEEAHVAAREILRHVRSGGRFREVAVLARSLDHHYQPIRRIFSRYGIPYFLDRRESIAHHPLAELTRFAIRTIAFGWRHDDWFGALKTGLVNAREEEIDSIENEALARGWTVRFWTASQDGSVPAEFNELRRRLAEPFIAFSIALGATTGDATGNAVGGTRRPELFSATGTTLASAIGELWRLLKLPEKLEAWTARSESQPRRSAHSAAWEQLHGWLESLRLGFASDALPLREWLPIIEAGLGNLSIGLIPPTIDQVLVGTVDRSRNPDLQMTIVLGLNEGIFPAMPSPGTFLTDAERESLEAESISLPGNRRFQMGLDRFLAYIAFTRARRRLVLSYARTDSEGSELHPSPLLDTVRSLFPGLVETPEEIQLDWRTAEHRDEVLSCLLAALAPATAHASRLAHPTLLELGSLPGLAPIVDRWRRIKEATGNDSRISSASIQRLFGNELLGSVSSLEDFAACPFKFFVGRGLRLRERKQFELDPRERGSFQHELMKEFHEAVTREGQRWRDLSPEQARDRTGRIGSQLLETYRDGLLTSTETARFSGRLLIEQVEKLIAVLIGWMPQLEFDPSFAEVGFGLGEAGLPPWRLELGSGRSLLLRGRIDRVDLLLDSATKTALALVIDYKSRARKLELIRLVHGLDVQLIAYLRVLSAREVSERLAPGWNLLPVGAFFVPLQPVTDLAKTRPAPGDESRQNPKGYQHSGRFDAQWLRQLDRRGARDQFRYSINKDGSLSQRGNDAMPTDEFRRLVDQVEAKLREMGTAILDGHTEVSPSRIGNKTACDECEFGAICRFDPWLDPYRVLRSHAAAAIQEQSAM